MIAPTHLVQDGIGKRVQSISVGLMMYMKLPITHSWAAAKIIITAAIFFLLALIDFISPENLIALN